MVRPEPERPVYHAFPPSICYIHWMALRPYSLIASLAVAVFPAVCLAGVMPHEHVSHCNAARSEHHHRPEGTNLVPVEVSGDHDGCSICLFHQLISSSWTDAVDCRPAPPVEDALQELETADLHNSILTPIEPRGPPSV